MTKSKQQARNAVILWLLIALTSFLLMSCGGARQAEKNRTKESSNSELVDKSTFANSETKTENAETNIKKSVETIVNDQDQTVTVKETIEPLDYLKPASIIENGKKIDLTNAKKTTESTTKKNNTNISKNENLIVSNKNTSQAEKKQSGHNDIKIKAVAKKEADNSNINREQWSIWNELWILILIPAYWLWINRGKIGRWIAELWWV